MSKEVLLKISGVPVYWDGEMIEYVGEMTCCADGSPRCYGPDDFDDPPPLDYLGNAGYPYNEDLPYGPGNWWGIVTENEVPVYQAHGNHEKHPYPGLFISCTAYGFYDEYDTDDCRCWVNAEQIYFSVIPGNVRTAVPPKFLGCKAMITDLKAGTELECVCAEIGPSTHMGEASMAAVEYFGFDPNPKHGGSSDKKRWKYQFWPGVPAPGWKLI